MRGILQRLDRIAPIGCEFGAARQQSLTLVDVERREARRAAGRMARIGIAVEQFDRSFGTGHHRVVNLALREHRAHREGAVGERSEEHTSELQSLMRTSYAVFCLKKKQIHTIPQIISYPTPTITKATLKDKPTL